MTAQSPDWLHYKGQRHALLSNPLESFFDDDHPRPDFKMPSTACWRGYSAEWEVEDDTLYLVGLEGWVGGDEDTYAVNSLHVGLEDLFPWAAGRVKATWFTGVLRVPRGERLEYVHLGYGSTYEEDLLLSFEEGKLVRTEIRDNRHPKPEEGIGYGECANSITRERIASWLKTQAIPVTVMVAATLVWRLMNRCENWEWGRKWGWVVPFAAFAALLLVSAGQKFRLWWRRRKELEELVAACDAAVEAVRQEIEQSKRKEGH